MTDPAMKITPPYTPELLPEVQRLIESFLDYRTRPNVLELGSGWSTIWFASMPNVYVESYEHNRGWFESVYEASTDAGVQYSKSLHLVEGRMFVSRVEEERKGRYDLVLVDCVDEARVPSLLACLSKVKNDGWIVVDDSHWDMFRHVLPLMEQLGYRSRTISGQHTRKTGEVKFHQTTIFSKSEV